MKNRSIASETKCATGRPIASDQQIQRWLNDKELKNWLNTSLCPVVRRDIIIISLVKLDKALEHLCTLVCSDKEHDWTTKFSGVVKLDGSSRTLPIIISIGVNAENWTLWLAYSWVNYHYMSPDWKKSALDF